MAIRVADNTEVTRFEQLKNDYESCPNFEEIFKTLADGLVHVHGDYFF